MLDTSEVKKSLEETEKRIIKQVLNDHSINWEMKDGKIIVENHYVRDGISAKFRVPCPSTVKGVLNWLGY